jgi:feruloyl esterase
VDSFARLFVIPQGGHGLSGRAAPIDGNGKVLTQVLQVPSSADRFAMLQNWVEKGIAPGRSERNCDCRRPEHAHVLVSGIPALPGR